MRITHDARRALTRVAAAAALLAAATLPGCGDGRVPVVVYSPHGEDILRQFEARFEARHPEADVQWYPMAPGDCLTRLRAEAGSPRADVWWGAPSATMALAASEGLLAPHRPEFADALPAGARDAEGRWHGQFLLPQVIVFNRDVMDAAAAPADWEDLASPAWDGRIVLRFPLPSGGMRGAFAALVAWQDDRHGEGAGFRFLERLHRNTKRYATNPTELFEAVKKDQDRVVTIWNLTDALFQRDRYGYPFGVAWPASGAPIVLDCIALVARGPRAADDDPRRAVLARAFHEEVSDHEALAILMREHWRIPARNDVPAEAKPEWLRELRIEPLPVDRAYVEAHEREWLSHWDERIRPLERG